MPSPASAYEEPEAEVLEDAPVSPGEAVAGTVPSEEVAGGAAELVDPTDTNAIAAGMTKLIQREDLRRDLVELGRKRASTMTWEQTARQMIALYRQLAA